MNHDDYRIAKGDVHQQAAEMTRRNQQRMLQDACLDNQGRGNRKQLPDGSGIVLGVIIGLTAWAMVSACWIAINAIWP